MIEDKEMHDIFKIESREHLQTLNDGLLRLEKDLRNKAILEELFREAHSLKGSARMLGLRDIETISHRFEDILNRALKNDSPLSRPMVDTLYKTLDIIKDLIEEALSGVSKGINVAEVLTRLDHPEEELVSETPKSMPKSSKGLPSPTPATESQSGEIHERVDLGIQAPGEAFRIDTIRVETQKLDQLMTHVGELIVSKLRFSRRPSEISEILERWEELARDLRVSLPPEFPFKERLDRFSGAIEKLRNDVTEDGSRLDFITGELEDGVRTIRLLPLSTIFCLFPRLARDISRDQGKETEFLIEGGETTADKKILEEMKDPLMHIIRNAIDHGIELPGEREARGKPRHGTILLKGYRTSSAVVLEVSDDGRGLDAEKIKQTALKQGLLREEEFNAISREHIQSLIFSPGFSTSAFVSDVSGRGVGLDVVRSKTELLKGTVSVSSRPGEGCTVRIALPVTLATARVLLLTVKGNTYALPVEFVLRSCFFHRNDLFSMEGRETVLFDNKAVSVASLGDLLQFRRADFLKKPEKKQASPSGPEEKSIPCIFLAIGEERLGLLVDELLDEQEVILKPQSGLLKRVNGVSGATILGTGEVCMILNPADLIRSLRRRKMAPAGKPSGEAKKEKKTILLAEDTMTTRIQMKRILEGAGYEVVAAVDGADAFGKIDSMPFDALVTDVVMPNMDGLTLTEKVRKIRKFRELPIILVTSLDSEEDKRKGAEAGANAYLTKPAFDQKILIETLRRLV